MFGPFSKDWRAFCAEHSQDACDCLLKPMPKGVTQRLDEMEFTRSACSAAQRGDCEKLRKMIERDPDAIHSDGTGGKSGYTPLHYAARAGHVAAVNLLLSNGARVDAATTQGFATPLHRAAGQGHDSVVQALLAAGADPSLQDADGENALHKAAAGGHGTTCTILLANSLDPASLLVVTDRKGRKAKNRAIGSATQALRSA